MLKNTIFSIFWPMIFLLTGGAAPHVGAEPESGKDVVVLESGHASKNGQTIVTLKPRPTPEPTPEVTPEPTAEPTPEPETTEEIPQESLAPNESAESSLNQPVTETADHSGGHKYCYLTFDDGPSKNTEAILKILNDKGIQATFFVVGKNAAEHPDRVKAIAAQGSLVANHTQTHETSVIYQYVESCLKAFDDGRDTIASILGSDYPNDLVRFPYGSTNRRCRDYRDAVKNAGYRFFDQAHVRRSGSGAQEHSGQAVQKGQRHHRADARYQQQDQHRQDAARRHRLHPEPGLHLRDAGAQAHELKPDAKEFPLRLVRGRNFFVRKTKKEERTAVNFQEEE